MHFIRKSGALDVENRQFDAVHPLAQALTFYAVVAWQLLEVTDALHQDPEQLAETLVERNELTLLSQANR